MITAVRSERKNDHFLKHLNAKTLFFGIDLPGYPSLLLLILFFGGFQIFAIGLLGQYIGRIFLETKQRPIYILRKKWVDGSQ